VDGKRRIFSDEFKRQIARMVVVQGLSRSEVAKTMSVSLSSVDRCVTRFEPELSHVPQPAIQAQTTAPSQPAERSEVELLREENCALRLTAANLRKALAVFIEPGLT